MRDGLQVVGVHAGSVPAEVSQLEAARDGTQRPRVGDPVREETSGPDPKLPVAHGRDPPPPSLVWRPRLHQMPDGGKGIESSVMLLKAAHHDVSIGAVRALYARRRDRNKGTPRGRVLRHGMPAPRRWSGGTWWIRFPKKKLGISRAQRT